jgi:hypothetical protein
VAVKRALLVAVAACSSNPGPHGTLIDGGPLADAPIDSAPDAPGPPTVELMAFGSTPTYAAYRAGSGAWQLVTSSDGHTYKIVADADYEFVAVCASTDGTLDETEIDAMASDGANIFSCQSDDSLGSATPTITVTGTMNQPGIVTLFEIASGSAGPWMFSLQVPPNSLQDLFAIGSGSMLIRRGVSISAAATQAVPTIDLSTDGTALATEPIAITGLGSDDAIYSQVALSTQYGFATISNGSSATSLVMPPASLIASGDSQLIAIDAYDATSDREFQTNDATVTTFALLPRLDDVAFADGSASWTSLPAASQRYQFQLAATGQSIGMTASVSISPAWLAATLATSIGFDDVAPGWQSAWSFWTTSAYQSSFTAETSNATTFQSTTAYGSGA